MHISSIQTSKWESTYMRGMIMKFSIIVQYGMVRMIQFQQMFQRARGLLMGCINFLDLHRRQRE